MNFGIFRNSGYSSLACQKTAYKHLYETWGDFGRWNLGSFRAGRFLPRKFQPKFCEIIPARYRRWQV